MMPVIHTAKNGMMTVHTLIGTITADALAQAKQWDVGSWREVGENEAAALMQPSLEEQQAAEVKAFMAAIQTRLDAFARTRVYDDARACVSVYLNCTNETFAAEAAYMQQAIVTTWEWANTYMNGVLSGEKPLPALHAFMAELEAAVPLAWPVPDTRMTAAHND